MTDDEIEQAIQAKGADVAPRVTLAQIEAAIEQEHIFTAGHAVTEAISSESPLWRLTFCLLELKNGFLVVGKSACVSAENFNAEIGRQVARQNAIDQCWELMGFQLASEAHGWSINRQ